LSLACLSGGVAGIACRFLVSFQGSLTFCSLQKLTCVLHKAQLAFSRLASLSLGDFASPFGELCSLAFHLSSFAGDAHGLSNCSALSKGRIVRASFGLETLLHGLTGSFSCTQPITKPFIPKATHARISLSRTARSVVADLIRYETSPVSSAGRSRTTS
jgi:hypothetical protein